MRKTVCTASLVTALLGTSATPVSAVMPEDAAGRTERVSVRTGGGQGNDGSGFPVLSGSGRLVAFASIATNLVAGDTNAVADVFVHDRTSRTTRRVSVGSAGRQGDGASFDPAISADGRVVAFTSRATNLVAGDTNGVLDVFVHELASGRTTRVSVSTTGVQGDGDSRAPSLSSSGAIVAFESEAQNLVRDGSDFFQDVFVHDRTGRSTSRVPIVACCSGGRSSGAPSISGDGRYVAFESQASLVAGDTNDDQDYPLNGQDVYLADRVTKQVTRVSRYNPRPAELPLSSRGPSISADGRRVAFESEAPIRRPDADNTSDVFLFDVTTGTAQVVSHRATMFSAGEPALSSNGRVVAFRANEQGAEDPQIFAYDRVTTLIERLSVTPAGRRANGFSAGPAINADGTVVAYFSQASNLVRQDTNGGYDVFVRVRG